MNARAAAATLAAGYVLAVGVWLLAQMHLTLGAGRPAADVALQGLRALLLVQFSVAVLGAPLFVAAANLRTAAAGLAFVVLAALPLVTFVALATSIPPTMLAAAQASVLGAALAVALGTSLGLRLARGAQARVLVLAVFQLGAAAIGWRVLPVWLEWLAL